MFATKLFIIFLFINSSRSNIKELNSVKWSEIGLRNVCPIEEFHMQLNKIKHEFKRCLHFKHILLDVDANSVDPTLNLSQNDLDEIEEEREMQKHFAAITYSKNKMMNPFCKLARSWDNCIKYVSPLNCLEPNAKSLVPVYLPRTVQEQLRRIYDIHAKQLRIIQPQESVKRPHSGEHEMIQYEQQDNYHIRMRTLKLEQLTDYYRFRCDQRVQLHIDSLDLPMKSAAPPIDRFQQEAFSDLF